MSLRLADHHGGLSRRLLNLCAYDIIILGSLIKGFFCALPSFALEKEATSLLHAEYFHTGGSDCVVMGCLLVPVVLLCSALLQAADGSNLGVAAQAVVTVVVDRLLTGVGSLDIGLPGIFT